MGSAGLLVHTWGKCGLFFKILNQKASFQRAIFLNLHPDYWRGQKASFTEKERKGGREKQKAGQTGCQG